MPTLEQINNQIASVGAEVSFLIKSDIKALPSVINADETFLNLIPGIYRDRNGILVLTNKRLIFVHKKMIGGITVESFQLNRVDSIQYNTGLLMADITIMSAGNAEKMQRASKKTVKSFCEMAQIQIHKSHESPKSNNSISNVEQLEKLMKLKDAGVLNEDEFQIEKKKILAL